MLIAMMQDYDKAKPSHGQEGIERKIRNQNPLGGQTLTDTETSCSTRPHLSTSLSPSLSPFAGSRL